jgi:hypothetical protein
MVWSPASQMIMWKPTPCQTLITTIAPMAVDGSASQAWPAHTPPVSMDSAELTRPSSWYRKRHSRLMTTIEVITGRK